MTNQSQLRRSTKQVFYAVESSFGILHEQQWVSTVKEAEIIADIWYAKGEKNVKILRITQTRKVEVVSI